MSDKQGNRRTKSQRGMSIFIVAAGLTLLLGIAGLAIDLANLYVARNEAQRAADAAALAGAQEIFQSGYASGLVDATIAAPLAATQASKVGNQNLVLGQDPDLDAGNFSATGCPPPTGVSGGCFDFTTYPNDPQITVVVRKNMPTYFMGIFGIKLVPVSAVAKAEVYIPEGNGPASVISCAKPWLTANCDPDHGGDLGDPEVNTNCPCTPGMTCYQTGDTNQQFTKYLVDPTTNKIVMPGVKPTGAIGEFLQVKTGNPTQTLTASQFNPVFFPGPTGTTPIYTCPTCAANDQQNSTSNSAALYSENIECCSSVTVTCGSTTIEPIQGNMVGPTDQGVNCLIHQKSSGKGQDCISLDASNTCGTPVNIALPFTIYAGSNNPYHTTPGQAIPTSDSLVTMPLYNGQALCPGNSCAASVSVDVQGYLTVFITNDSAGSVNAYVTGITPCGGDGGGAGGVPIPAAPGNPVPIRLIH